MRNIVYYPVTGKPVIWMGTSREDIRKVPAAARQKLGKDLRQIQCGGLPRDWKMMTSVGSGVIEVRISAEGAFRLMYVAKFAEGIYVLHVFQKKTRKTSPLDLALTRARYATALRNRPEE